MFYRPFNQLNWGIVCVCFAWGGFLFIFRKFAHKFAFLSSQGGRFFIGLMSVIFAVLLYYAIIEMGWITPAKCLPLKIVS